MEEEKKGTFTIMNKEGKEIEYEILFTFESEETNHNYMVYTDNTLDETGNVKVYASIFDPKDKTPKLIPIETEKEWKIIESILESLQEKADSKEEPAAPKEQ